MRLEVNGHTAADNADADAIKYAIGDLYSETETSIILHDADDVVMRANGSPKTGFAMTYVNPNSGVELASANTRLKPRAVMRVLKHYLARDVLWRVDVTWIPVTEAAIAEEKARAWRRSRPVILGLLFFAIAFVPFVFGTKAALDALVFEPLCARHDPDVLHYSHGGGGSLGDLGASYTPPTCWYEDRSSVALEQIIGGSAGLLDTLAQIAQVVVPSLVIVGLLLAFQWFRRRATA